MAFPPLPQATKVKFAKNVVYGGIAGWVGALTTYPIDRIKNTHAAPTTFHLPSPPSLPPPFPGCSLR